MLSVQLVDVTPEALVRKHRHDAVRIVELMIAHAIAKGQRDEALDVDRMRRVVVLNL